VLLARPQGDLEFEISHIRQESSVCANVTQWRYIRQSTDGELVESEERINCGARIRKWPSENDEELPQQTRIVCILDRVDVWIKV